MEAIYTKAENREKLKEIYNCSDSTVSEALSFKRSSIKCRRIRSTVMNLMGGIFF